MSKPRGLAAMSAERRREIASKGGKKAHAMGKAHKFTHDEAVAAGKKGGKKAQARGKVHRFTHEEAVAAGKKAAATRKSST